MPAVRAVVEYDGTDFSGFQRQPSARTVQGELERALGRLFGMPEVRITGSGRTDAGVHATGQVVQFEAPEEFPVERIVPAVNGLLPPDVALRSAEPAPEGFHSRYSAKSRTYIYVILNRELPSPLLARYSWHLTSPLDLAAMKSGAAGLTGARDFASFGMPHRRGYSTVRRVLDIRFARRGDLIFCRVRGTAFLRGMVRGMVGALVEIGLGRHEPGHIDQLLEARDRRAAHLTAPPQGLYLSRVEY